MVDAKAELVRAWLLKAQHDLEAAVALAGGASPLLDIAIYHCQQGAEKAVKAFLVCADQEFGKTHDLETLVSAAARAEPLFAEWVDSVDSLTPYATAYRYPSEKLDPDVTEFQEALRVASGFYGFVLSVLPESLKSPDGAHG